MPHRPNIGSPSRDRPSVLALGGSECRSAAVSIADAVVVPATRKASSLARSYRSCGSHSQHLRAQFGCHVGEALRWAETEFLPKQVQRFRCL